MADVCVYADPTSSFEGSNRYARTDTVGAAARFAS